MPISLNDALSLYSIPLVWFTSFYPMTMKFITIDRTMGYNNVQPRANTAKFVHNEIVPPTLADRVERMEGAHLNGNEALPLWSAAILAGNFAGLDNRFLNKVSAIYITMRFVYNYVYINHETMRRSWLRSALFFGSLSLPLTILFKAANKVRLAGN